MRESLTMQIPFPNGEQAILYINKDAEHLEVCLVCHSTFNSC